ncbi:unnamed protein product [Wuchereria bancrofti]|uniref:Immunoglobulin I-set domain-containing protein n=1 Tax=Wuchereria bancrofti TaxID=6293 RepID=A0A3P7DJG9_WUCBA|nr:unnamed protein product [Wuchereria bancrofti]
MSLAPFFDKAPSIINKPDGSVLFECMCNANPEPTMQWFFKDKELSGDRYTMKIKKMVGKWTCTMTMKVIRNVAQKSLKTKFASQLK